MSDNSARATKAEIVARILTLAGSVFCGFSIKMTFAHSQSELFEAPDYPKGRKHPRYHAYRGGTLALGAVAALNVYAWTDARERLGKSFGTAIAAVAAGYFLGWWPPQAFGRLGTPNKTAERVHRAGAALCLSSLVLTHPWFRSARNALGRK